MSNEQPSIQWLDRLAESLRQRGLSAPAIMLLHLARPLGFVGGQCLMLLQPLAPVPEWQQRIGETAALLEDEATWMRLENLLQ